VRIPERTASQRVDHVSTRATSCVRTAHVGRRSDAGERNLAGCLQPSHDRVVQRDGYLR
jgi:hypothetical protein